MNDTEREHERAWHELHLGAGVLEEIEADEKRPNLERSRKSSPWARRCPKGHASIENVPSTSEYRCQICEAHYRSPPVDAREVDGFPIDEDDPRHTVVRMIGGGSR